MNADITSLAKKRYQSHKKHGSGVTQEELIKLFQDNYEQGFICGYCGEGLKIKTPPPDLPIYTASLDHKLSISNYGKHEINNLIVCCLGCNQLKGATNADTFTNIINILKRENKELLNKWKVESYKSNLRLKINRVEFNETLS